MKLNLNGFKVTITTNKGMFGSTALCHRGLNVIRAENSSGKSAIINGILYALGLEILVGKRGIEATKPAMWSTIDYDNIEYNVIESFVELEITNSSSETITVRRYVVGEKDNRLIEVVWGSLITTPHIKHCKVESYFVGMEGAAQRERGFHYFLANFLKLELPYVKRFKGEDVPLYVECIAPLMFIEQVRGWSGIQATLPQSFGIRNVAKLAVEYILNLDVIENDKLRTQIAEEASRIRENWQAVRESMLKIASQVGGRLLNMPTGPVAVLTEEPYINLSIEGEEITTFDKSIVEKRRQLLDKSSDEMPKVEGKEELEAKLENYENELIRAQAEFSQLLYDINSEEDDLRKLQERQDFIEADTKRNKDIIRLRGFGDEIGLSLIKDKCPTCNQKIKESLIPTESVVMDIEENINFLESEAEAIKLLISARKVNLTNFNNSKIQKSKDVANLRTAIRDLRFDLLQNRDLSVAEIREQIHLQEEIVKLEQLREEFNSLIDNLSEVSTRWKLNRARYSELPDEYFTEKDKAKLEAVSKSFAKNVEAFGYRSTGFSRLHISEDNYRPVCDEFEVAFGASASDNIRLIWAYTLALMQVSLSQNGNHWGILVFDEPEQQQMKEASSDILYKEIGKMPKEDYQVIIATSASIEMTRRRLSELPHNLIEFGEKVIRPIND